MPACLSVYLPVSQSVCLLSISLSACLLLCLSIYLFVYLIPTLLISGIYPSKPLRQTHISSYHDVDSYFIEHHDSDSSKACNINHSFISYHCIDYCMLLCIFYEVMIFFFIQLLLFMATMASTHSSVICICLPRCPS